MLTRFRDGEQKEFGFCVNIRYPCFENTDQADEHARVYRY